MCKRVIQKQLISLLWSEKKASELWRAMPDAEKAHTKKMRKKLLQEAKAKSNDSDSSDSSDSSDGSDESSNSSSEASSSSSSGSSDSEEEKVDKKKKRKKTVSRKKKKTFFSNYR